MTDNGSTHSRLFSAGMRGGKNTPYQGGTRVPSFWRWPGTLPTGVDVPRLTAHVDLFPTFLELAGARMPGGVRLDGRSLVPLLQDAQAPCRIVSSSSISAGGPGPSRRFQTSRLRRAQCPVPVRKRLPTVRPGRRSRGNQQCHRPTPDTVAALRQAYDQWWSEVRPLMVNEDAVGPKVNPFKASTGNNSAALPTPICCAGWTLWNNSRSSEHGSPRMRYPW